MIRIKVSRERLCLVIGIVLVILGYLPLILPIFDPRLVFAYGDFTALAGPDSGGRRFNMTYYAFNQYTGESGAVTYRAFGVEWISILSNIFKITDSQIQSILLIISLVIGIVGLFKLVKLFNGSLNCPIYIVALIYYYFSLWAVERIGHFWIFLGYAVFTALLYLGFKYMKDGTVTHLLLYGVIAGTYGLIPHLFIYMFILSIYLFISGIAIKKVKYSLIFLISSLIYLVILNSYSLLPLLLSQGLEYPVPISVDMLMYLSRHGELIRLFSMSNNWWPQVPPEAIFNNLPFLISSIFLFIIIVLPIIKINRIKYLYEFRILIISIIFILMIFFVAQGVNNPIIYKLLMITDKNFLNLFVAPFREWGRIGILIPPVVITMLIIYTKCFNNKIFLSLIFIIVVINVVFSPSWLYLYNVYSPVNIPQEYYNIAEEVGSSKVLWINPTDASLVLGTWRCTWNPDKAVSDVLTKQSVGSTYSDKFLLMTMLESKEAPCNLLKFLGIRYIIYRTDILGYKTFLVNYSKTCYETIYRGYLTVLRANSSNPPVFEGYPLFLVTGSSDVSLYNSFYYYEYAPVVSRPFLVNSSAPLYIISTESNPLTELSLLKIATERLGIVVAPADYTTRYNPYVAWSFAYTSNPCCGGWTPVASQYGIDVWQTDLGFGVVVTSATGARLVIPINLDEGGWYKLYVRVLESPVGGAVGLDVDNYTWRLSTRGEVSRFGWKNLGLVHLEKGRHTVTLINLDGFNAVNLILLVNNTIFIKTEKEVEEFLQRSRLVYVFEAESMNYINASVVASPSSSNGAELKLRADGAAWQDFYIYRPGVYYVEVKASGNLDVLLDERELFVISDKYGNTSLYGVPVRLERGLHRILLRPYGNVSRIDVLWIRPIEFDVRSVPPVKVRYRQISPVRWEVIVNSTSPLLLVFRQGYDPNWKAEIYRNGKLVGETKAVPVAEVMNGFIINQTGYLHIYILYSAQRYLELGIVIYFTTIIITILLIIINKINLLRLFSKRYY